VLVAPFDDSALDTDDRWVGEAVGEVLRLALVQHQAFIPIERARLRGGQGAAKTWSNEVVQQAARATRADVAIFGRVTRAGTDLVIHPRYLEVKPGSEAASLEDLLVPEGQLLAKLGTLPVVYTRALKVSLTEAETAKMEKAARPTRSLRALELYARAHMALARGGQEANESAVDLLSRRVGRTFDESEHQSAKEAAKLVGYDSYLDALLLQFGHQVVYLLGFGDKVWLTDNVFQFKVGITG